MHDPFDAKPLIEAIRDWATTLPRGYRLSGSSDGLAYLQLHTHPDPQGPEVQLTFRPVIVDGHAVIKVEHLSLNTTSAGKREAVDRDVVRAAESSAPWDVRVAPTLPERRPRCISFAWRVGQSSRRGIARVGVRKINSGGIASSAGWNRRTAPD
jgi:hypothetical protein